MTDDEWLEFDDVKEQLEQSIRRNDQLETELNEMEDQLRATQLKQEVARNQSQTTTATAATTAATTAAATEGYQRDIEQYQTLLDSERKAKQQLESKITALEDERQQLAQDMQGAAQHLRLVALQKSSVTHELEQVHSALAELEKQLIQSRSENDRLRNSSHSSRRSNTSTAPLTTPSSTLHNTPTSRAKIHVSRTGSIAITRTDGAGSNSVPEAQAAAAPTSTAQPAMIPLPSRTSHALQANGTKDTSNVRVRTNRHGSVDISTRGKKQSLVLYLHTQYV